MPAPVVVDGDPYSVEMPCGSKPALKHRSTKQVPVETNDINPYRSDRSDLARRRWLVLAGKRQSLKTVGHPKESLDVNVHFRARLRLGRAR